MPGFKIKKQEGYVLSTAEKETLEAITVLGDPGADRILFWDESANTWKFLTVGSGLNITDTTITSTGLVNPMTAVGDTIYGGVAGAATRLAGNITTTTKFFTQVGDGTDSAAPSWGLDFSTDGTFADNSDTKIPSQKAIKTYADLKAPIASPTFTGTVKAPALELEGTTLKMLSLKNTDADSYTRMLFDGTGIDFLAGVGNANAAIEALRDKFYIYDFTNSVTRMTIDGSGNIDFFGTVRLPKTTEIFDTSADHKYQLAVSELTADRTVTLPLLTGNDEFTFNAHTQTLTNKRVTPRVSTEESSATPTINTDNVDAHSITALAADITSMTTNLSGTPTNFQRLMIRIKDNGTARAIAWGASFEAKGVALPTTTVISKVLTVGFIYDTVTSKWGCVASAQEA